MWFVVCSLANGQFAGDVKATRKKWREIDDSLMSEDVRERVS